MATYVEIASVTVGSGGAATMDFSSIPSTYTDLKIVVSARSTASASLDDMYIRFNGSTASVYSSKNLRGNGSSTSSGSSSGTAVYIATVPAATNTASTFNNLEIYVPNYTSSNAKSFSVDMVQESNGTTAWSGLIAGLWSPAVQVAITDISLFPDTSFAQYSTAYLYGIKKD
jgi:hypothetical protein